MKVKFQATIFTEGEKNKSRDWEVIIHYSLSNIEKIAAANAPLRFVVRYYKATLI